MICVSIAHTSRRLALVDIQNASRFADLVEIRLDRFESSPEVKALLEVCAKQSLVSCRRTADGGDWTGTETARLALLRQAILEKADYVEVELDVAKEVRRYGTTKRVISYTNIQEVPANLDQIYDECCKADADVVKLVLPARSPEEAFPILKLIARGKTPTVAIGFGKNGLMLNILGRRYKAPWTYAALEKGMETYPGMATIGELEEIYRFSSIDPKTPLFAVCGFGEEQSLACRLLNRGFELAKAKTRTIPIDIGNLALFKKVIDAIKLEGALVDDPHRQSILDVCTEVEENAEKSRCADFVNISGDKWKGYNTVGRSVARAVEAAYSAKLGEGASLAGRTFFVVGTSPTGRSVVRALQSLDCRLVVADPDNDHAQKSASELGTRFVPSGNVYTTVCDGVVICPPSIGPDSRLPKLEIPRSFAREGLVGLELTGNLSPCPFIQELALANGIVVSSIDVLVGRLRSILQASTGEKIRAEDLFAVIPRED